MKDDTTEIIFLLDHVALYRLAKNENELFLSVPQAKLQAELPNFTYLNTAIEGFATATQDDAMQFKLLLREGTSIKSTDLFEHDGKAELVLTLLQHQMNGFEDANSKFKTQAYQSMLRQQYQNALIAAQKGLLPTAISTLQTLIKIDPGFIDARVSLIAIFLKQDELYKAKMLLNEGLRLQPDCIAYIELKARLLTMQGKIREALTVLQTASPPITENPQYHAFLAALYEQSNQNELAFKLYRKLLMLQPAEGNWWLGLGVAAEKLGKNTQARQAYNKALEVGHLSVESVTFLQQRLQIFKPVEME